MLAPGAAYPQLSPMMKRFFLLKSCHTLLLRGPALAASADDIKMDWQPSGVSKTAGYYRPLRLVLSSDKPEGIKTAPAELAQSPSPKRESALGLIHDWEVLPPVPEIDEIVAVYLANRLMPAERWATPIIWPSPLTIAVIYW
jgi:hypothetical protein